VGAQRSEERLVFTAAGDEECWLPRVAAATVNRETAPA
jgi:hypothetical protein